MICERHDEVINCINDHDKRIRNLEISDATIIQILDSLRQSIQELVGWLKIGILGLAGTGAGFIIWYIQNI